MLKFEQLQFRNFRSYGNNTTTVDFDKPGTTLIIGSSDTGGTTNGHGKTSILHCLTWVVYDTVIDSVNKDELINNINKADMWGQVTFTVNGDRIIVQRWRKGGKSKREHGASITINGEDATPAGNDSINKKIAGIIGVDFDLFSRIVVFSATNKSFFDLPTSSAGDVNQTSMVERLFDLQVLSEKASVLKVAIKGTEGELALQQGLIAQATKAVEEYGVLIQKTKLRTKTWEDVNKTKINELQHDLKALEHVDFDVEKRAHSTISKLAPIAQELKQTANVLKDHVQRPVTTIERLTSERASLVESTCPYCHQHFATAADRIAHIDEEITRNMKVHADLLEEQEAVTADLESVLKRLNAAKGETKFDDFQQLVELKERHHEMVAALEALKAQANPYVETLQEILDSKPVEPTFDAVNALTTVSEHQSFLLKLLTKKDSFVRKALLQKNLPFLNERLSYYLGELGLVHTVEFTPNLTPLITQFGRELSFGCFSNGQKARVNFALSLAFGDVLHKHHQKINIQLYDEVLDIGLDSHGIAAASKLLKQKARDDGLSMFIISHRDEVQSVFEKTLVVKQIDGFSQLVQ